MIKRLGSIRKVINPNGSCSIWIDNARLYPNGFYKINQIIRAFAVGKELYFGHYKVDGVNISNAEFKQYGMEIPTYFEKCGKYHPIVKDVLKRGKVCSYKELTVCCAPNYEETYKMIEKVFHYYLETILFSPKVEWDTFVHSYSNYMNITTNDYVLNGYTDFLFSYVDSGDFFVTFDPKLYTPQIVLEEVRKIVMEN